MFSIILFVVACGSSEPNPSASTAASSETPSSSSDAASSSEDKPVSVASNPTAVEALKTADAADGTEDGVAHKCAGCALGMDGDAAHALKVDDTTLHLCSGFCKETFAKDVPGNLEKLVN